MIRQMLSILNGCNNRRMLMPEAHIKLITRRRSPSPLRQTKRSRTRCCCVLDSREHFAIPSHVTIMPSSDYASAVGGGLKLKGAKDAGVKKHKKKKPKPDTEEAKPTGEEGDKSFVQRALAEEEDGDDAERTVVTKQQEQEARELGKTEAQRRHEERRRKRVCLVFTMGHISRRVFE